MRRPLTDREREVLRWLDDEGWRRPMDIGASDGSHHSHTLAVLVGHGLVERQRRSAAPWTKRGGWEYRRTPAGRTMVYGTRPIELLAGKR